MIGDRYEVVLSSAARRAIERDLPEAVAVAVVDFVYGALAENPHRVGKPLRFALSGLHAARRGQYRIVYEIVEARVLVNVISVAHRSDAYR